MIFLGIIYLRQIGVKCTSTVFKLSSGFIASPQTSPGIDYLKNHVFRYFLILSLEL